MSQNLAEFCGLLRYLILISTTAAGTGHPTSSLSAVELLATLMFDGYFRSDLSSPSYANNDRLIFSKGHACPLLYSVYTVLGVVSVDELNTLRQFESVLEGHPTMRWQFTEAATGSLGQGLGVGAGMAINAKYTGLDYNTWVILGDSEMAEGSVWEAMASASYRKLDNLIAIVDVNRLGQRGETMLGHNTEMYRQRCESFGWESFVIDGHDLDMIKQSFETITSDKSKNNGKPKIIIATTFKGKGVSFLENVEGWHGKALNLEQFHDAERELGEIRTDLIGSVSLPHPTNIVSQTKKTNKQSSLVQYKLHTNTSTRKSYGENLVQLVGSDPSIMVLDAEMNNSTFSEFVAQKYPDQFVECFIAEQNMISIATGLSCRGKKPFLSTFAAFLTRGFDQIRMAQYSHSNLKIMGSHCGVSIGPDGSSQMAVEDISMMRSIHDSIVLYPSDGVSTGKLLSLTNDFMGISYLRCTRADLPVIYDNEETFVIGGSKTIQTSKKDVITVFAAGITLHETLKAYQALQSQGIYIRVVDLYSIKPLDIEVIQRADSETNHLIVVEDHYREGGIYEAVCGSGAVSKAIYSLAVTKMSRSGTPAELMRYMGIDAEAIVTLVKEVLKH